MQKMTFIMRDTSPEYLENLVKKIGLSKYALAKYLNVDYSHFMSYFRDKSKKSAHDCPYAIQLILEFLAKGFRL